MPWKQNYTISDEIGIRDADVRWPDGKRCCLSLVVDLSPASTPAGITAGDLTHPTSLFGITVGLQNVMQLLRRFDLRASRPKGWFSLPRQQDAFAVGTVSTVTMSLLIDAGYSYMGNGLADDAPHYWVADVLQRKTILTLPYHYSCDDQFFLMFPVEGTGLDRVNALKRNWRREFDAQYRRGRCFSLTVHPKGIGWGHHAEAFEQILAYITGFPGLWNATGSECAEHWLATYPADSHLRLSPSIWQDHEGSLS